MSTLIFVNLPVSDLSASIAFYEAIGGERNPQFSDDTAACIVVSETIHVMLLTHEKFMRFSPRPIADVRSNVQALFCLSADSRDAVNALVDKVDAAGGKADPTPADDYGFMFGRSYEDPDGHLWQVMWMDVAAMPKTPAADC